MKEPSENSKSTIRFPYLENLKASLDQIEEVTEESYLLSPL